MATSLQKQLTALRASRNNELDVKAQKAAHAKSLLFEPTIASLQSFDVIYDLCLEGFEQLCALDPRYLPFRATLFSRQSKTQDRSLLTASQNEKLSSVIDSFLTLVGGSVLLRPAQLAVEWLIRRFRINELNTEALVMAFLPHHLMPVFLTVLSILPSELPPSVRILHRYANVRSNPPRRALVQAAIEDASFFSAINRHVINVCRSNFHYQALISMWATIITQAVNGLLDTAKSGQLEVQRQRKEDLLTRILPVLNEALTLKDVPELLIGGHMAVIVIASKANLDGRALDAIMSTVALGCTRETCESALACLSIIAEQRSDLAIPHFAWNKISRVENLGRHLVRLSRHQSVQALTRGLALGFVARIHKRCIPGAVEFLDDLMKSNLLPKNERSALMKSLGILLQTGKSDMALNRDIRKQLEDLEACLITWIDFDMEGAPPIRSRRLNQPGTYALIDSPVKNPKVTGIDFLALNNKLSGDLGATFAQIASTSRHWSFLAKASPLPFKELSHAFELLLSAPSKTVEDFLELPILGREIAESSPLFFSFFAKVWCSSRSVAVRSKALRIASEQVTHLQKRSPDLQVLIPYLLVGLADRARKVRRNAADVLVALGSFVNTENQIRDHVMIYGENTPQSTWVPRMIAADFIHKCLIPALEECVSDESHIAVVLRIGFGSRATGESSSKERRLKTDQKAIIFSSISTHTRLTNCSAARLAFLKLLNGANKIGGQPRSHFLLPCLRDFVSEANMHYEDCKDENVSLADLTSYMFKIVTSDDQDALKFLYELATKDSDTSITHLRLGAFHRIANIWPRLPINDQKSLVVDLFRFALSHSSNQSDRAGATNVLKHVRLHPDVLTVLIKETLGARQHTAAPKKQRIENLGLVTPQDNEESDQKFLAGLTLAMELTDNYKSAATIEHLRSFFEVLQELQNYSMRTSSDLAYLTNLTLSTLSRTVRGLNGDAESKRLVVQIVRPDLLVDCVRNTNSSRTRSSALLLLSELAKELPQIVLHSVMPIFTMMSATTARLSDDFSAHVVDQTIQDVIPVLVQKLHEQKKDLVSATAEILLSFAASFDHIPPHRRLQLFRLLASSLGADASLFAIIATLSDRFSANSEVLKFSSTLFLQFGSSVSLVTISKTLDLIIDGLKPSPTLFQTLIKQDAGLGGRDRSLLNLIQTVSNLLKDPAFRASLQFDLLSGQGEADGLQNSLRFCFQSIFNVSCIASAVIKPAASQLLEQILLLFPTNAMAVLIEPLLAQPDDALCRSLLITLERRIKIDGKSDRAAKSAIINLLPSLMPILESLTRPTLKPSALACVDQICEKYGKLDKRATLNAVKVVSGQSCLESDDVLLQALSFHCLASAVETLQNEFIPLLGPAESATSSSLATCITMTDAKLHNAVFAFLISLAENLPFMVSEQFLRLVLESMQKCTLASFGHEEYETRAQFFKTIAAKVDLNKITRATLKIWPGGVTKGHMALRESVYLVQYLVQCRPKSEIYRNSREIFRLFHEMLDFRRAAFCTSGTYSSQEIDSLEHMIIEALVDVVLKVNDNIFRPFFVQLVEWSSSRTLDSDTQASSLRAVVLFNLTLRLSERLKSIFTPYFGHVLDYACDILKDDSSGTSVRRSVLSALNSSFTHDQDDFWQRPSHFESILEPLVSQLSSYSMQSLSVQLNLGITGLGVAASSNEHLKAMNSLLLKLCRDDSNHTRLSAVKCQQQLTQRLGDEWLSNLPEMLPRINELQEDDDEEVERETHRWIKLIEDQLGESLTSMLQ